MIGSKSDGALVAFQGEPGAYSEAAARQIFGKALGDPTSLQCRGYPKFDDVFSAVKSGEVVYGFVPVENTLGGSIHANYDLLLKNSNIHVVGELDFHVQHCLLVPRGCAKSDIRKVISHWQALAQCDQYLRAWGVDFQASYDTAGSAKIIQAQGLRDTAAIASSLAGEVYGLDVLARGIQDVQFNHTRFLLLSRDACAIPHEPGPPSSSPGVKSTVIFWMPHTPGALFKAVSAFSLRGLAILKTESRPIPLTHLQKYMAETQPSDGRGSGQQPLLDAKYHYVFYLDVAAHSAAEDMKCALEHLAELTPFVRVLGPYPTAGALTPDVVEIARAAAPLPSAQAVAMSSPGLRIGIVGFGKFGEFLANKLKEQHEIFASAREEESAAAAEAMGCTWVPWESCVQNMLQKHGVQVLILCVSIMSFREVVSGLPVSALQQAKPLVVDVLSVKGYAKQVMLKHLPEECDILCTHPMFGPESGKNGWHDLPFVFEIVRAQQSERAQNIIAFFKSSGCRMVSMEAEEHDKQTAASQFITHLTGRVVAAHGCGKTPIDTVGYRNLCNIAENTCQDSFELFYGLFKYNPNARHQLNLIKKGIADVEQQLRGQLDEEQGAKRSEGGQSSLRLSSVLSRLSDSKTARIQALSEQLQDEGCVVNAALRAGEPGYAPPPEVLKAVRVAPHEGHTKYTVVQGDSKLREAICRDLQKRKGVEYKPNQIVVTCSGKQAVYQAILAVCEEGDEVLVPTPSRASYHEVASLCRATPIPIATNASEGYMLQPGPLASALHASGPRCRCLVLCNPCNPTGTTIPSASLHAIAEVLRRPEFAHVYVLADEMYERVVYDTDHVCFASLPGMKNRTLLVNGFSKGYAMSGLGLGYLAAGSIPAATAVGKLQGQITSCASSISQQAALVALDGGAAIEEWVHSRVSELKHNRDFLLGKLRALPGVECQTPQGAFYLLPDISNVLQAAHSKIKTSEEFCCLLLQKYKVALVPGEAFHAPGAVRISYACSMEALEVAMDAFARCINDLSL